MKKRILYERSSKTHFIHNLHYIKNLINSAQTRAIDFLKLGPKDQYNINTDGGECFISQTPISSSVSCPVIIIVKILTTQ